MNNVYLIYGSDYLLIKREIDKICNNKKDIIKYDLSTTKIDELLDDACMISFLDDQKVIIGENCIFLTGEQTNIEHNIDYLTKYINDKNDNIVILTVLSDKLDERKKIVKLLKQSVTVIYKEVIDEKNLGKFVINEFKTNGYNIDFKTSNYFVDFVGKNIDILVSEINKMILFKGEDKEITIKDIEDISSRGFNDNVFDLTDAIMKKDFKKIYACYNDLIIVGNDPIKILSLISSQFILIYQCKLLEKNGKNKEQMKEILGIHPYRIKLFLETDFLIYELEDIIKKLHQLDYELKSGKSDKTSALETFFLYL